jgi:tetratricopeptide (TPR) repeat protein
MESNRAWLQKKLGYCFRKKGDFRMAISYYKKVEIQEPENLEIQVSLGQIFIDLEDYQEALKYYFKVEYLRPNLIKAQRPIGWCSFLLKKSDQAIRYFAKVAEAEGNRSDYLNLAHAHWGNKNLTEAIDNYRLALKHSANDTNWFRKSMQNDSMHLQSYGIGELEIALMTDYLILDI